MQFRNDSHIDFTVMTDPPVVVAPGDVLEIDDHVAGLTPVDAAGGLETAGDQVDEVEVPAVDDNSLRGDAVAADDQVDAGAAPAVTDQGVTP